MQNGGGGKEDLSSRTVMGRARDVREEREWSAGGICLTDKL